MTSFIFYDQVSRSFIIHSSDYQMRRQCIGCYPLRHKRVGMHFYVQQGSEPPAQHICNRRHDCKAASEVISFKTYPDQMSVKYVKTFKDEAIRCGDAFFKQQNKRIFTKRLPLIARDNMQMSWMVLVAMHMQRFCNKGTSWCGWVTKIHIRLYHRSWSSIETIVRKTDLGRAGTRITPKPFWGI